MRKSWNDYYNALVIYYKKYGNIDVPGKYQIKGLKLGIWLMGQRQAYKGHSSSKISKEQISKLNELGMKWDIRVTWDEHYKLLEEYYNEHGNIDIPQNYVVNGVCLGTWLSTQRQIYKGKIKCNLTQEQISKLNKLGMKWELNNNLEEIYKLIEEYYNEHGNIDIPQDYEVNGIKLGIWLTTRRQAYRDKGSFRITKEQIIRLNKYNMDWIPNDTRILNKNISNMNIYNSVLLDRMNYVLRDLTLEKINSIDTKETKEEIEKLIIKKIWK